MWSSYDYDSRMRESSSHFGNEQDAQGLCTSLLPTSVAALDFMPLGFTGTIQQTIRSDYNLHERELATKNHCDPVFVAILIPPGPTLLQSIDVNTPFWPNAYPDVALVLWSLQCSIVICRRNGNIDAA